MRHFQVYGADDGQVRWRDITSEVAFRRAGNLDWDPADNMNGMVHFFTVNLPDEKVAYGPRS